MTAPDEYEQKARELYREEIGNLSDRFSLSTIDAIATVTWDEPS